MSLEAVLIPAGMIAYAAIRDHMAPHDFENSMQCRITSRDLLLDSLTSLGAESIEFDGSYISAQLHGRTVRFHAVEGHVIGRVEGGTEDEIKQMLAALDSRAGQLIQISKTAEIRERATEMGYELVGEEIADDGTIQLVYEEIG